VGLFGPPRRLTRYNTPPESLWAAAPCGRLQRIASCPAARLQD
jgi:hypothetical protein